MAYPDVLEPSRNRIARTEELRRELELLALRIESVLEIEPGGGRA